MILIGDPPKPIGVPKPNSPGVSYTLWRLKLENLRVPREKISGVISKVAVYAEAPAEVFCLTFTDWDELYAAAAKGAFAKKLDSSGSGSVSKTTVSLAPVRTSVEHLVVALIDHPIVVYKGDKLSEEVLIAINRDSSVDQEIRLRASAQWGERNQAQDFFEDAVPGNSKEQIIVDDYEPNSEDQRTKIRDALAAFAVTGTLFIIGHCDGESHRLAGLTGDVLAGLCDGALAGARSVVLWGCHTAGQAASSQAAALLSGGSVASAFHGALTVSKQVQGFTCFVGIGGMAVTRLRFTSEDAHTAATWSTVGHRFESTLGNACKHIAAS